MNYLTDGYATCAKQLVFVCFREIEREQMKVIRTKVEGRSFNKHKNSDNK